MNNSTQAEWELADDAWTRVEHDGSSQPDETDPFANNWDHSAPEVRRSYKQGGTIDWMDEESSERAHKQHLKSQYGLRGIVLPLLDSWRTWLVLILSGAGIGVIGAWLDVLVAWLSDLRTGRCTYGFFYNQASCCSGLDPGEICHEWATWSEYFGISSIFVQSILHSVIYVALAVAFATTASFFVQHYAPYAFHTGIPEIKAILGGFVLDAFLGPWTLLVKAIGLALAVASGLSLGKEGPLVHVSSCLASLLLSLIKPVTTAQSPFQKQNESQRRKILAAAATAGVAIAFGSPLGGVLFGLEELDTKLFSDEQLIWRAFVTSAVAATTLAYIDPFGSGKLVLFQVTTSQLWRGFELAPWLVLGVIGGLLGALLIKLNVQAAVYRRHSPIRDWPILEVALVTAATAVISWPVVFMRYTLEVYFLTAS
ncbi:hypothetical protein FRC03_008939 [Tulasnella sp. 419]|nr:hypothetical protein FRC03_008939 [Tulasnella sp. 419]